MKRIFDLLVSGTVLLILAVPLAIVIAILKFTGEREAFYFQDRVGYLGKIIKVTKLVTMVKDSPNLGTQDITLRNDPRVASKTPATKKTAIETFPDQLTSLFHELFAEPREKVLIILTTPQLKSSDFSQRVYVFFQFQKVLFNIFLGIISVYSRRILFEA